MAAEPHRAGSTFQPVGHIHHAPPLSQVWTDSQARTFVVDLPAGPMRRLVYRSVVAGHVTCSVYGADVVGSAGVPLRTQAVATACTADEARQQALRKVLAQHAAGFWDDQALTKHPPQPPHGMGPGPWVCMSVGDDEERQVWMPAARVYSPFRLTDGRLTGDEDGLACGGSMEAARSCAQLQQVERRAVLPWWQALERQLRDRDVSPVAPSGVCDLVVAHASGLSLAFSFQWSMEGPLFGLAGLGCAATDELALAQARVDRAHTEAQLRLQQAGVWGGLPQGCPPGMDPQIHRLAWRPDAAMAMAALASRWRARAKPQGGGFARRSALAWADITPPALREMGLWVVRALWLDGEGGAFSRPVPPSRPH